jgi:hypothetical protein
MISVKFDPSTHTRAIGTPSPARCAGERNSGNEPQCLLVSHSGHKETFAIPHVLQ